MNLSFLLTPVFGALIGYITNDIAIRMLFRPFRARYIGRFKLPFTPGLIPREKNRIAGAVAHTVSHDLLDEQALRTSLTGEEMRSRIGAFAEELKQKAFSAERSPKELLYQYAGEERTQETLEQAEHRISEYICRRLHDADAGGMVTAMIAGKLVSKMPFLPGQMVSAISEQMAAWLNEQILAKGPKLVYDVLKGEAERLMEQPVSRLLAPTSDKLDNVGEIAWNWYLRLIDSALPKAVQAVDIEGIVRDKINSLDPAQLEGLIRGLMKRELNAIIWLGCLLGFIMGWINALLTLI